MTAFTDFQAKLSAVGLHYSIDHEIRRRDKSLYQWATIRSAIPNITVTLSVLALLRKDGNFDLWVLFNTRMQSDRIVDDLAAHFVSEMTKYGCTTDADDDEWIALATRGYGEGEQESDRIPNPSARWLESKVRSLAGA